MSKWVVGGLAVGVAAAVGAYYLNSSSSDQNEDENKVSEKESKVKQPVQKQESDDENEDDDVPIDKLTPEQKEMLLKDRYGFLAEISEWMKKDPASGTEAQIIKFLNNNVYRLDDGFIWMVERLALVDFADEQAEVLIGALTLLAQLVALLGARINFQNNEKYRMGVVEACVNTVRIHMKAKGQTSRYIDLTKFLITVYTQHVSHYTGYEEEFATMSNKILACWEEIAAVVSEEENPEEWASVQLNLGVVYSMLGNDVDPESQKHLHSAITCCNNALKYFKEEHKEQYGQLHKVLGTAYWALHNVIRTETKGPNSAQLYQQAMEDMEEPDYQSDEDELARMLQAHLGIQDEEEEDEEQEEQESRVQEIDSDEEKAINEENERKLHGTEQPTEAQDNSNNTNNDTENKPADAAVIEKTKTPQPAPMSPEESVYVEKAIDSLEKAYQVFENSKQSAATTIMLMQIHSHLTELYSCRDQGDAEENRNKARLHSDKALEIIGKMRRQ